MNKKIILGLATIFLLCFGTNLLGDPIPPSLDNLLVVGYSDSYTGNDEAALTAMGWGSLIGSDLATWESPSGGSGWSVDTTAPENVSDGDGYTTAMFVWNGSGVVEYILLKADGYAILFQLQTSLVSGDSQLISSDPNTWIFNGNVNEEDVTSKTYAISHITGYGTTSVPEPATLVLLGLGLVAVPLVRRYTS